MTGFTLLEARQGVLLASASFLSVFAFLVAFRPPEAYHGLFVIPILLSGRIGFRAGGIAAAIAVGLHSLVRSATDGALFPAAFDAHTLGTWLIFAAVGAAAGTMSVHNREPSRRANRDAPTEFDALGEIGRIISSSLDIDDVYRRLAPQARRLIRFDRMSVIVVDFDRGTASTAYTTGIEMPGWEPGVTLQLEGAAAVIRTGADLVAESSEPGSPPDEGPLAQRNISGPAIRSTLQVPLVSNQHTIGVLALDSRKPGAYSKRDLDIAQHIGGQIAAAVVNAQLHIKQKRAEIANVELEQRLRRADNMEALGRLAGGVAHDINNLLTPIIAYSTLGRTLISPDDHLNEYLREIGKAGECAARLTRQLLTSSQQQAIRTQVIDVNSMIMNVDNMLRRIIGEQIELVFLPGRGPGLVSVDSALMEQVLINLVVNARDAMPGGGRIMIESGRTVVRNEDSGSQSHLRPGEYVTLSVSDTGTGIPSDTIERIFEPYFTTKNAGQGTGLGLSTSQGTVSRMGGPIEVESEPGRGSTFVVYLPESRGDALGAPSAEEALVETQRAPGDSETVMVV